MKNIFLALITAVLPMVSSAGMQAPLLSSLHSIQAVVQEIPNQSGFFDEVVSIQNKGEDVEVFFRSECRHLYSIEVKMNPVGVVTDIKAILKQKTSCEN